MSKTANPAGKAKITTLSRSDLSKLVAKLAVISQVKASEVVEGITAAIIGTISKGGAVRMKGFGTFTQHKSPVRMGRNPRTGEVVKIPARKSMKFRAVIKLRNM